MYNKWYSFGTLVCFSTLTAGCASLCDSSIVNVGPDTYYAEGMCGGQEEVRSGGEYCRRQGKQILVTNMRGYGDRGQNKTIFRCLAPNDPGLSRPSYQRSPDIIIQDNRR